MSDKKSHEQDGLDQDDMQLFMEEMSDVRPLKPDNRVEKPKNKPRFHRLRQQSEMRDDFVDENEVLSDPVNLRDAAPDDFLFFARSGIQHKVQRKLRQGEYLVEDELDLHGYTVAEAKSALVDYIAECKRRGLKYIRIIHGKGFRSEDKVPVLKTHIAWWLPQHSDVMAFSSARPADGGTGAVYVILKLQR